MNRNAVTPKKASLAKLAGLRRLYERQRRRMSAEKSLHRGRRRRPWAAGARGAQKFEKLFTGVGREAVRRLTDDVRVDVLRQVKADRESAGIGVRIVVGQHGNACRIREPGPSPESMRVSRAARESETVPAVTGKKCRSTADLWRGPGENPDAGRTWYRVEQSARRQA